MTPDALADAICDRINDCDDYAATLWTKHATESRVYVRTTCKKKSDCGYVAVSQSGVTRHLSRQGGTIEKLYADLLATPIEQVPTGGTAPRTRQQVLDDEGNDWHVADGKPEDD